MNEPTDGGPAFPQPNHIVDTPSWVMEARQWLEDSGMSLRDWFAGHALAGLSGTTLRHYEEIARTAYNMADAMLKHRSEQQ